MQDEVDAGAKPERACNTTRRGVMFGVAALPTVSLPALAEGRSDARVTDLVRRLLEGIRAEIPLRLALESAWAASERTRRELLEANRHEHSLVRDLLQKTEQGRARAVAYEQWNGVCQECLSLSEAILTEKASTGPGLAAHVVANHYVQRRGSLNWHDSALRAAMDMLGEKPPSDMHGLREAAA